MRISTTLVAVGLFLGLQSGVALAAPLTLEPTSDWRLDEYDDKCRISRSFASGEDRVTLWIDKGSTGPSVNLTLIGGPMRNPFGPVVRIAFVPGDAVERNYIKLNSSKGRPVVSMFGVQPIAFSTQPETDARISISGDETVDLSAGVSADDASPREVEARLMAIKSLDLSGALVQPLSLQMEGFPAAMTDLFGCTGKLVERLRTAPASPTTPRDLKEWAAKVSANYPNYLLSQEQEGSVGVRMTVDRTGRASFCEVIRYSGPASFNDTACLQLLTHARFNPARDSDGNPVASFYSTTVTYQINK